MSFEYHELRAVINDSIKLFGQPCTVVTESAGVYDPATSTMVSGGSLTRNAYCVAQSIGSSFGAFGSKVAQTSSAVEVLVGDVMMMVTSDSQIMVGDKLTAGYSTWRALNVDAECPADVVLMYTVHLRK